MISFYCYNIAYNQVDKLTDILMSFFNKMLKSVYEKVVEDQFSQPLTEQEIYHIINKNPSQTSCKVNLDAHNQQPKEDILAIINAITQQTTQIQFRKLGNQPPIEKIHARLSALKQKLAIVDKYMLSNYQHYLRNINLSVSQYDQTKEIFITRKKSIQLKFILEKMTKMLAKGKIISRLNIKLNNIKNVLKIIEKIPNIKKMNLIQLKTINLSKLQQISEEIMKTHKRQLNCLQNLSKYISKVNNQSFVYIINNLKSTIDSYDITVYEDIIKSYLIIQPNTPLEKLLYSLIEQKVRDIFYHHSGNSEELIKIGHKISNLMMNIHQIIKWHIFHKAIQSKSPPKHKKHLQNQSSQGNNINNQTRDRSISLDSVEVRPRQLSLDSNHSQQGVNSIELSEIVFIDLLTLKTRFNEIIDNSVCQFAQENITSQQLQPKHVYEYINVLSKLCQLCNNFTGLDNPKIKRLISDYYIKKELLLYNKLSKDLFDILQEQRTNHHWNRCAYPNNFKYRPIDKMLYKLKNYQESHQFHKIKLNVHRFFGREREIRYELEDEGNQEGLDMVVVKMPDVDKFQKDYEDIYGKEYLDLHVGDAILSHSTIKTLNLFQKYVQFMMYAPLSCQFYTYFQHMAIFIEYQIYYIFHSLLSPKYKNIFYESYDQSLATQKKYTLKRMYHFYPTLTFFLNKYKAIVCDLNENHPRARIYAILKKQIKDQSSGEEKQILRAKVIASESCKYLLAYFNQIYKHNRNQFVKLNDVQTDISTLKVILGQLSNILLSQSCQGMLGKELETIRGLFQSIRWHEPYQELKEYVNKIISIIRQSYEKLKSSHRGQIPLNIIHRIFVLIWRTLMTYAVKLFLQNKANNRKECKLNFERYIDQLYNQFKKNQTAELQSYNQSYQIFKSIFPILLNNDEEQTRKLIRIIIKKYDYIYPILIHIVENIEIMNRINQRQKEILRAEIREEVEQFLKEKK